MPRTTLEELNFTAADFILDSKHIADMGRHLTSTIFTEDLLDPLSFKFG